MLSPSLRTTLLICFLIGAPIAGVATFVAWVLSNSLLPPISRIGVPIVGVVVFLLAATLVWLGRRRS